MEKLPRFVPFGAPRISAQEIRAMIRVLKSGWIGTGPKVEEFEAAIRRSIGCRYAVALSSCSAGLHLSLIVSGIGPGDEVITTPLTFAATANVIDHVGAKVVFADVDPKTYNLDPKSAKRKITKRTKAIIPVHFAGLPVDLDAFATLARRHRLTIIEDAAHAIGARYHGRIVGDSDNLVSFSFYPNKNLTTAEGGVVTTNRDHRVKRMRILRLHGMDRDAWRRYRLRRTQAAVAVEPGFKYNLTDLQAALGIEQLRNLERWQRVRERYAKVYDAAFKRLPGVTLQYRPTDLGKNRHSLHLYTLRLDSQRFHLSRDEVVRELNRQNIGATVHYYCLHLHPYYRRMGYRRGMFPNAERISDTIFTIPLTPHLTARTIRQVARTVRGVLERARK